MTCATKEKGRATPEKKYRRRVGDNEGRKKEEKKSRGRVKGKGQGEGSAQHVAECQPELNHETHSDQREPLERG